jgi:hypothetical protein
MVQRVTDYTRPLTKDMLKHPIGNESAKQIARTITRLDTSQVAAADLTSSFVMRARGRVVAARALLGGAVAAAGESLTFDVLIDGTTALAGVGTVDNTTAADAWVQAEVDPAAAAFDRGALVQIVRDYTAGGGPTPMTNTLIEVDIEYTE